MPPVVDKALRSQATCEETAVELQVQLAELGHRDLALIVRTLTEIAVARAPQRPTPIGTIRLLKKAA